MSNRHNHSTETLRHWRCGECARWWTIGGMSYADCAYIADHGMWCPWCGRRSDVTDLPDVTEPVRRRAATRQDAAELITALADTLDIGANSVLYSLAAHIGHEAARDISRAITQGRGDVA